MKMKKIFIIYSQLADSSLSFGSFEALLEADNWQVEFLSSIGADILLSRVDERVNQVKCLAVLGQPKFSSRQELSVILEFSRQGGSLLLASSSTDELAGARRSDALNHLAAPFGVHFNRDSIIRPNLYRHFHPKEAMLEDFIANRGLADSMRKYRTTRDSIGTTTAIENILRTAKHEDQSPEEELMRIIYPYGCSLRVNKKEATVMMVSSKWALPSGRPICAFHTPAPTGETPRRVGRVVALGSAALVSDRFLDEEDNRPLARAIIDYLGLDKSFQINSSDARTANTGDEKPVEPAIDRLVDLPVSCLQECEPLPDHRASLLDRRLFKISGNMIPFIVRAYTDLNVEPGPLTVVKPHHDPGAGLNLEPATHGFLLATSTDQ